MQKLKKEAQGLTVNHTQKQQEELKVKIESESWERFNGFG